MGKLNVSAIDKTGNFTIGHPENVEVMTENELSENEILIMAAAVEKGSAHPLGGAIKRWSVTQGIRIQDATKVVMVPGKGIEGCLGDDLIRLGIQDWIRDNSPVNSISSRLSQGALDQRRVGRTVFLFHATDSPWIG